MLIENRAVIYKYLNLLREFYMSLFPVLNFPEKESEKVYGFPKNLTITGESEFKPKLKSRSAAEKIEKLLKKWSALTEGGKGGEKAVTFFARQKILAEELHFLQWQEDLEIENQGGKATVSKYVFQQSPAVRAYTLALFFLGIKTESFMNSLEHGYSGGAIDRFIKQLENNEELIKSGTAEKDGMLYLFKPLSLEFKPSEASSVFYELDLLPEKTEQKEAEVLEILQYRDTDGEVAYRLGNSAASSSPFKKISLAELKNLLLKAKEIFQTKEWTRENNEVCKNLFNTDFSQYIGMQTRQQSRDAPPFFPFIFGGYPFSIDHVIKSQKNYKCRVASNKCAEISLEDKKEEKEPTNGLEIEKSEISTKILSKQLSKIASTPCSPPQTPLEKALTELNCLCWDPKVAFALSSLAYVSNAANKRLLEKDPTLLHMDLSSRWAYTSCGWNAKAIATVIAQGSTDQKEKILLSKMVPSLVNQVETSAEDLRKSKDSKVINFYNIFLDHSHSSTNDDYHGRYTGHAFTFIQYYLNGQVRYKRLDAYLFGGTLWSRLLHGAVASQAGDGTFTQSEFREKFLIPFQQLAQAAGNGWDNETIAVYRKLFGSYHLNRFGLNFSNSDNSLAGNWNTITTKVDNLLEDIKDLKNKPLPSIEFLDAKTYYEKNKETDKGGFTPRIEKELKTKNFMKK